MIPMEPVLRRIPAAIGQVAAFALFVVFKDVQLGYLGVPGVFRLDVPDWLYDCRVLTPFGFPFPDSAPVTTSRFCRGCSCISAGIS